MLQALTARQRQRQGGDKAALFKAALFNFFSKAKNEKTSFRFRVRVDRPEIQLLFLRGLLRANKTRAIGC